MHFLTARMRMTMGLACLSVSIVLAASFIGIIPDRAKTIRQGRAVLCEAIAVYSSVLVSRRDQSRLDVVLQKLVERNADVLSAGVRREDGRLVVEVGEHNEQWQSVDQGRSDKSQILVPLWSGDKKWGTVELRFAPLEQAGWAGMIRNPIMNLSVFVGSATFLVFFYYLGKILHQLDPSKAVPKRVRTAFDSLAEGLLIIDQNERVLFTNQSFSNWIGTPPEKIVGRTANAINWVLPESSDGQANYPWSRAIDEEQSQAGEIIGLTDADGIQRRLKMSASPLVGHDGTCRGVMVSFDDVTQLEETKKELSVSKQAAEDANQAKSEFLARMSHEIRTPMNAILGFTDVLRRGFEGSVQERHEYLNTIHSSREHLLNLINDILDLSKVESGKLKVESRRCSPYQVVTEVATVLRVRAQEKGVDLTISALGKLPESILSDAVRLRQIITNLVGNAIKFTDEGGVRVQLRLVDSPASSRADGGQLKIDVIDSGIGMKPDALAKIFNPFSQADNSITRQFGGTGLGLSISKRLAEAMGGEVTVQSDYGHGSTFTVVVATGSLEDVAMVDAETLEARCLEVAQQGETTVDLPPCKILVADDSPANRKLIHLVLERAGATVTLAANGQEALEHATQQSYDIIFMDMQMPVMDGYTATRHLRDQGYDLPIIALTADAMRGSEEKCRQAGCSGFMTKPIDMDKLIGTVADLLGHVPSKKPAAPLSDPANRPLPAPAHGPANGTNRAGQLAENQRSLAAGDNAPLESSLPTDDPEFAEVVVEFQDRLAEQLEAMDEAVAQRDLQKLAKLAHWLKGSGGTVGLDAFTEPARQLELAAKGEATDRLEVLVENVRGLAQRIAIPAGGTNTPPTAVSPLKATAGSMDPAATSVPCNDDVPLVSSLPIDDPEFVEIVVEFVDRLCEKLDEMDRAWQEGDVEELAKLAHWLKGSGGMVGLEAFTETARELEVFSKQGPADRIPASLQQLRRISGRVVTS